MRIRVTLAALSLALPSMFGGIAAGKVMQGDWMTEAQLQAKVDADPEIRRVRKYSLPALPAGTEVEVYFKKFNLANMTTPKVHFVMGEGRVPAWKATRIASIKLYHFRRADPLVLASFKKIAASLGGTALINVGREPVLLEGSLRPRRDEADPGYDIIGYAYFADVVVKR